jgi:hypothetical protein
MNVKMTAMAVAPGLLIAALGAGQRREIGRRVGSLAAGTLVCSCVCGLAVLVGSNMVHYGRPLGPAWIGKLVSPEYGPLDLVHIRPNENAPERSAHKARVQFYVHAARAIVYLLEPPDLPSEGLRQIAEKRGNELAHLIRADKPLDLETDNVWPGKFRYTIQHNATRYSLWGMLWIPVLVIGSVSAAREVWKSRLSLSAPAILMALHVPFFLGVVFLIRWMGDGPARFWVGAYALAIPSGIWLASRWTARSPIAAGVWFFALAMTSLATLRANIVRLDWFVLHPLTPQHVDDRMHEVIPLIPPHSTILLVAGDSTRDYGLFDPRCGFCNRVYSWGTGAFDQGAAEAMIAKHEVTHIVIENDTQVNLWTGAVDTRPMVEWLSRRSDFREIAMKTPNVRMFVRSARGGGS